MANGTVQHPTPKAPVQAASDGLTELDELATAGLVVHSDEGHYITRAIAAGNLGIEVENGDGSSGAPAISVSALLLALHNLTAAAGIVAKSGAATVAARTITGTTGKVSVTNGDGAAGNPTIGMTGYEVCSPMTVYGTWAVDGDTARTNGGGIVGAGAGQLTAIGSTFAFVDDGGVFSTLAAGDGSRTAYKLLPNAPANNDAVYWGNTIPWGELGMDMSATLFVYTGDAVVWEYWDGASWSGFPAGTFYDNTAAAVHTGARPFTRDGAIVFFPPANWASKALNGIYTGSPAGYYIRARVSAFGNIGTVGVTNSVNGDYVSANGNIACRAVATGTITAIRAVCSETSLGSVTDTKFYILNETTGATTGLLTWTVTQRIAVFGPLTLAVTKGDVLRVAVTQENGTTEHLNVLMEVTYTLT